MRISASIGALACFVVVAGCAPPVPGQAVGTPVGTAVRELPRSAPQDEIDLGRFDPCTALTSAQAERLGAEGPSPGTSANGTVSCIWGRYESEPLELFTVEGNSTIGIKSINAMGEPFTVGHFPAVFGRHPTADAQKTCAVILGIGDDQTLLVNYDYNGSQPMTHDQACEKARAAAEMVASNLTPR